ncbi:hypothetical protein AbraIFM66951_001951 [Aspergillus brasiliensis]|uniref:Protein kinase domain-containing protein n=1 Tax=Aspergillus brasiliensis TaxID=319629 RepID=A0A9W5YNK0_9EURO|nr:hypothetical protein AbraCBS73388_002748 [Aspergillus brasiliensis]GKZ42557.1 hypothetical protein AbraIFM66951_001951 [Aspergillus brasiliensis]
MAAIQTLPDDAFGDFVRNSDEEEDIEMDVEPRRKYDMKSTSAALYPICLGEVLNGRYLIEHKIGYGGGSTVWMAHDIREKKDVALKVASLGEWAENEIRMQDEVRRSVQDASHYVTYIDTFELPRDKDHRHHVLVFPLMGPCVDYSYVVKMPVSTRMYAARQLLEALEKLHQAGIVHRDLSSQNCMWGMTSLDHLDRNEKYEILSRPMRQTIQNVDLWKKGELVQPLKVPENLLTEDFYLGDFALSKKVGESVTQRGYPPSVFCSPERLHGKDTGFACDMWSYTVVFSELYLKVPLFCSIADVTRYFGPLPEDWKGSCVFEGGLDSWYDQTQTPAAGSLEHCIAFLRPETDETERQHWITLMRKMFTYCPEERLTATQLLQDPSFRAIMDKYGC